MISAVKGKIFDIDPGVVHIETGAGYVVKVLIPVSSYSKIRDREEVLLHTVMRQKDEEVFLYGFISRKEKYFFEKMISISGIGGKTALSFISAFSIDEFVQAVNGADVVKLSSVPGIGKKTAQRIVLELTGKLEFAEAEVDDAGARLKEDLISGLVNLGYPHRGVKDSVNRIMEQNPEESSFEILFKQVLKKVSKL